MNYIKIDPYDIANGPGVRVSLWVAGCEHHCKECHNPETWDLNAGQYFDMDDIYNILLKYVMKKHIRGLTITGGDPLHTENRETVFKICDAMKLHLPEKDVWVYTGYKYEDLDLPDTIDVLVDGEFMIDKKNISLPWYGSTNQRVIDVKRSKQTNSIVLYEEHI